MERLGGLIGRRRKRMGMTQAELARSAGVTREWLSQVESGRIVQPGFQQLESVAHALEMPAETLLSSAGYNVASQGVPPPRPLIDLVRELLARLEEQEGKNPSAGARDDEAVSGGRGHFAALGVRDLVSA